MSTNNPSSSFHHAASYLSSVSSISTVSPAIKLELYGLYKYITVSTTPSISRPSIFDMTGRAKWEAWNTAGKRYVGVTDAESRYMEIARSLGWSDEAALVNFQKSKADPSDGDDIWDKDDYRGSNGGSGMGNAVSAMAPPPEEEDRSIHGLAVSNDAQGMSLYLEEHPDVDLNERDEFGYTPLHLASDRGNLSAVKFLLDKGADSTIEDPDGLSASELAHVAGHDEIRAILSLPT